MATKNYKRVFVWEMPVRVFHWLNALSITVLAITGYFIAKPPAFMSSAEAFNSYLFGTIRVVHFVAAYIFVAVMIMRVYWAFAGNRYARLTALLPFSKKGRKNFMHVLKHDILLLPEKEGHDLSQISVGHNRVAGFSYIVMFFVALVMVATGFGLYADNANWFFPRLFGWVPEFLGGDFAARAIHHAGLWIFALFTIVHVYLVLFHDWLEGRGETSSMLSGFKFVRRERMNPKFLRKLEKIEKLNKKDDDATIDPQDIPLPQ